MKQFFLVGILSFTAMHFALANGSHGLFFEKVNKDHWIGIGTDVTQMVAGETVRFDFDLRKDAPREAVEYSDIWVRVIEKRSGQTDRTVFAGGLYRPEIGWPGMSFVFPNGGSYELTTIFNKNGEVLTDEVAFPLSVSGAIVTSSGQREIIAMVGGVLIGAIVAFFFRRKSQ